MLPVDLVLDRSTYGRLQQHLFPASSDSEEAAFLYCSVRDEAARTTLRVVEAQYLPADAFLSRSAWYLELSDETRAAVIKRAHDLQAALVECHSHPDQERAEFSASDLTGFQDFVPHVRWRLKNRPYAALLFTRSTFDALVWDGDAHPARPLRSIHLGHEHLFPTGATIQNWETFP